MFWSTASRSSSHSPLATWDGAPTSHLSWRSWTAKWPTVWTKWARKMWRSKWAMERKLLKCPGKSTWRIMWRRSRYTLDKVVNTIKCFYFSIGLESNPARLPVYLLYWQVGLYYVPLRVWGMVGDVGHYYMFLFMQCFLCNVFDLIWPSVISRPCGILQNLFIGE